MLAFFAGFFAGVGTFDIAALRALLSCGGAVIGIIGTTVTTVGEGGSYG